VDIIWYLHSGHTYTYLPAYSSNLKTLSKSIHGFKKTTETSVKIIFKNIKD